MSDFVDLVMSRYSCRNYHPINIDNALISEILELAHFAPSATNAQPWRIYVLNTPESLEKIQQAYNREWFKTAPAVLMLCAQTDAAWTRADGKNHADIDVAILADHITLVAADKGLATCWVCNFDTNIIEQNFNLPQNCKPIVLLPIGVPATTQVQEKKRKDLDEIVEFL